MLLPYRPALQTVAKTACPSYNGGPVEPGAHRTAWSRASFGR